ncbi:hypothetical protein C2W62_40620 [Candidatus Entotheonella serta]|nr:hypothetical protein C2W62_40620 [Candidatus Entotheonella serta]
MLHISYLHIKYIFSCALSTLEPLPPIHHDGEAFLVALPSCNSPQAIAWAETLRTEIDASSRIWATDMVPLTCRIGVMSNDVAQRMEPLIVAAEAALYHTKLNGRNRVELATMEDLAADALR